MMCDCKVTDDLKHTTYAILKNIKEDVNEDSCNGAFLFIVDCFKQIVLKFSGVSINNRCIFCLNDEESFKNKRVAVLQKYVPKKRSYSIYTFKESNEANPLAENCIRDTKASDNLKSSCSITGNKCSSNFVSSTGHTVNSGSKIGNQTSGGAAVKDKRTVVEESKRNCVLPKGSRVESVGKKLLEADTNVVSNQLNSVKVGEGSKRNCVVPKRRRVEAVDKKLLGTVRNVANNHLKSVRVGEESKRNCVLPKRSRVEAMGKKLLEADTNVVRNQLKPRLKTKSIDNIREVSSKKKQRIEGKTDSGELPKTKCNPRRDNLPGRRVGGKKLQPAKVFNSSDEGAKSKIKVSNLAALPTQSHKVLSQNDPRTPSRRRSKGLSYKTQTPTQLQLNQTLKRVKIQSNKAGALSKAATKGLQTSAQKTNCKLEHPKSYSINKVQIFEKSEEEVSKPFERMHGVLSVIKADVEGTLNNLAQLQANYNSKVYSLDFLLD